MLISDILNDSFGLLSKQLRFYCWHFRRTLDQKQRQELVELLYDQHFEALANKIRSLNQSAISDCKQQVGKLLFEHCFNRNRRHQLIQLIESDLVDINVRLDNYGRTLLHRSAYNLDLELIRILIEKGVNIRLRDYAGNTALHIAIQSYRNGAIIYGNGPGVVQALSSIITLLLEADKNLQYERIKRKRIRLNNEDNYHNYNSKSKSRDLLEEPYVKVDTSTQTDLHNSPLINQKHHKRKGTRHMNRLETNETGMLQSTEKLNDQSVVLDSVSSVQTDYTSDKINPILLEDSSTSLVDTKNAFGRTALHYCVLVVGEQHLSHFVQLLLSFGADTDATDTRMKTPLYCLVKRPGVSAIRQKCLAITQLLESGCDDLGLAIKDRSFFTNKLTDKFEKDLTLLLQSKVEESKDPIFNEQTFKRVPSLKHIVRLKLIKLKDESTNLGRQTRIILPNSTPGTLNLYLNRKILAQSELF